MRTRKKEPRARRAVASLTTVRMFARNKINPRIAALERRVRELERLVKARR